MVFDGLKPTSARLVGTLAGIMLLLFGTSFAFGQDVLDYGRVIIMITLAMILSAEVGLKFYTKLSDLRKLGLMQWISLSLVVILLLGAITSIPFLPLTTPEFVLNLLDWVIGIGAVFIILEAWM